MVRSRKGMSFVATIKIGWGQTDITPIGKIGKKVSVCGQFHERITSDVHDPLHAVAMVVENDEGVCAAIVSLDLALTSDKMMDLARAKLAERLPEFPARSLILAATHTHTAPDFREIGEGYLGESIGFYCKDPDVIRPEAYLDFLTGQIAEAVASAWHARAPGGLAFRVGRVAVPHCRRVRYKDGSAAMYGNTDTERFLRVEGNADNGVEYVFAYDSAGQLTGALINLACPAQVLESKYFLSADIWGAVRAQWTECPYLVTLCGAAGDITMRDLVRRYRMEAPMNDVAGMNDQAGRIVRESRYTLSTVKPDDIQFDLTVKHLVRHIMLPISTVTDEQFIAAKAFRDNLNREYELNGTAAESPDSIPLLLKDRYPYYQATATIKRHAFQQQSRAVNMELHALRLGPSVLVTNSFELYQDYGMQIKARSPFAQIIIAQLACGHRGYLSTDYALSGGGYGSVVVSGYCGPEGGQVLVEKTMEAIRQLQDA